MRRDPAMIEALAESMIQTNDGWSSYEGRCALARRDAPERVSTWAMLAKARATHLAREEDLEPFTVAEILHAAADVAAYYADHVAELDNHQPQRSPAP